MAGEKKVLEFLFYEGVELLQEQQVRSARFTRDAFHTASLVYVMDGSGVND
jgi:hypothetical protein